MSGSSETKARRRDDPAESELRFLRQYKDAILHFNLLDRNLAYCLAWATRPMNAGPDFAKAFCLSYDRKLRRIASLIKSRNHEEAYRDFSSLAEQCRLLRNRLVHGRWEFKAWLEKPISFHIAEPFEESGRLTQEEFAAQTRIFRKAVNLFNRRRKSHPIEGL